MTTVTIEISDSSKEFMDREIAAGRFKDSGAVVQTALEQLMRSQWKEDCDKKLEESIEEYERGDFAPYKTGDFGHMGREYLNEKRAQEKKA